MAFYAVWVQTGKEQVVTDALLARRIPGLESIFTLDRFTAILHDVPSIDEVIELSSSDYLHKKEMRTLLQAMRSISCEQGNSNTREMMQSYRKALCELTEAYRQQREHPTALLQGYLLIEVACEEQLDADVWHLIKEVPYVIGLPSELAIPDAEVMDFFTQNPFVFVTSILKQMMWPFTLESVLFRLTSQVEEVRLVWSTALRQFIRKRLV